MDAAPDPVARARERFAVRDYHGAVLLLREAVVEGLAYADGFNLLHKRRASCAPALGKDEKGTTPPGKADTRQAKSPRSNTIA